VASFNDLVKFADQQATASSNGTVGAIGRDSVLRGLRNALRNTLLGTHGSGALMRLAEAGIGFTRTGELKFDRTAFTAALNADPAAVQSLFTDPQTGAFSEVNSLIDDYTSAGGFLPDARLRLSNEIARVGRQMDDMSARLAVRRAALQAEFTAADEAMARLNSQKSSLSNITSDLFSSNL
jgi:flagellar hook-associated protein 2